MKVLMVCLGNICRSPMAEGILRYKAQEAGLDIQTDSAGTADYHIGEAPDNRAIETMLRHGIDINDLRARQFQALDFNQFDRIFAMDRYNLSDMLELAGSEMDAKKVKLILDLAPSQELNSVPDPYYGGEEGFEHVFQMLDEACNILIEELRG